MANSVTQCFSLNYKEILLDEIALDGLQGIGTESLWKRVENRVDSPITSKIKEKFWHFLTNSKSISIYHVSETPPVIEIVDRFTIVDEATGYILDPNKYLDGPYEWCPVENQFGSCSNYSSRVLLSKSELQTMTYAEVISQYGVNLVLVASIKERWHALAPHLPIIDLNHLTTIHYGLLELIGKGRQNGQMTVGTSNLNKIIKEPKLLFYNRTVLQKLDLIEVHYTTQLTYGKAMKSILLRLKRFHQPMLGSLPKIGLIANIVEHLLLQPDHSEVNEILIKKGLMSPKDSKRFQKAMTIFTFEDRDVNDEKYKFTKTEKQKEFVKKKFISLTQKSDASSSDEEDENTAMQCQYKVGVGLMRQAYEKILEAGLIGLTRTEIAQILGVEFYTSRSICRIFKTKKLVREFLEDKGRQRTARYIAVAATKEIDKEYAKEKNILLEHAKSAKETTVIDNNSDSDNDIPIKKLKLEKGNKVIEIKIKENTENTITELKVLEGFENVKDSLLNAKKNLTLRQLKYANGMLKVIKAQNYIIGFQTLNMVVSREIGESPMDTKALKLFVHKLMTDGQLKVLKITKPKKVYFLICAPYIKPTDEVITKIYKKLCPKPELNRKINDRKTDPVRPKWQFIHQRYIKIQKLHEFVTKFVYFNDDRSKTKFSPGFTSLLTIIPEMTVEFALSNISNVDTSDVAKVKIKEDVKGLKIRDAPEKLNNLLSQSKSLQSSIKVVLKVLAALGLIQLVHQPQTSRKIAASTLVFYVNRRAKILNTSGKWPREVDDSVIAKSFYFDTFENVKKYWHDVTTISSNTIMNAAKRETFKLVHPLRSETDVELYDNGEQLGDGLGPCGFDSSIFMDIPRLWRKFVFKLPNTQTRTQQALPKRKIKKIVKKSNRKLTKVVDKDNLIPKVNKRKRHAVSPLVKWTDFEDKIIMFCNAAITVLSPSSQPGSLRLRNIVARDLLTMKDPNKTAAYCHKRSMVLESNSVLSYERDCIVNEMRRNRHVIQKYDGLLKALRLRHVGSTAKYITEARLPLLELIWLASQIEKMKPYAQQVPCIALNFDDFNKNYTITPTTSNRPYNVYKTPTTSEPEFATLKEAIILTVMLSINNPVSKQIAKKIYSIFEVYPEPTLRCAVEQLRKAGAISAREKYMNNNLNKVHFDDIVESSYKISGLYRRKLVNKFDSEFIANLGDLLVSEIPDKGLKGTCELNCLLCELNACDVLDIKSDSIPVVTGSAGSIIQEEQMNVIDLETKYKLKSGTVGWTSKWNTKCIPEFYQDIKCIGILDSISMDNVVSSADSDIVYDMTDPLIFHLDKAGEKGCSFLELQKKSSIDRDVLHARLKDLEAKKMVKRVGYFENILTLMKYATPMLLQIEPNFHIIPAPWLTLDGQVQVELFIKWTNVVVNKVFESPGCTVEYLSNTSECISTRSVQDICKFLHSCECVTLRYIEKKAVDLYSEDDEVEALLDYSQYDSPDHILVFPAKNMLTRYASIRKSLLQGTDSVVL